MREVYWKYFLCCILGSPTIVPQDVSSTKYAGYFNPFPVREWVRTLVQAGAVRYLIIAWLVISEWDCLARAWFAVRRVPIQQVQCCNKKNAPETKRIKKIVGITITVFRRLFRSSRQHYTAPLISLILSLEYRTSFVSKPLLPWQALK